MYFRRGWWDAFICVEIFYRVENVLENLSKESFDIIIVWVAKGT
jgi:hypothetical protein